MYTINISAKDEIRFELESFCITQSHQYMSSVRRFPFVVRSLVDVSLGLFVHGFLRLLDFCRTEMQVQIVPQRRT